MILFSIVGLSSCQLDEKLQEEDVKTLWEEFVRLKYEGAFRTDTIFEQKLQSQLNLALKNGDAKAGKRILEFETEWNFLKGMEAIASKKVDDLKKYSSNSPDETLQWFLAYNELNKKNFDAAILILKNLLKKQELAADLNLKANWLLGTIYEEQGIDSLAIKYYSIASQLGPVNNEFDYYLESTFHLGNMRYINDEVDRSVEIYQKALDESIKYKVTRLVPVGFYHLAKVEERQGKHENALLNYNKALEYVIQELNQSEHFIIPLIRNKIESLENQ